MVYRDAAVPFIVPPRLHHAGCPRRQALSSWFALDRWLRAGRTSYVQPSSFKTVVMLRGSSFFSALVSGAWS
jgi:hypothetical protein